MEKSTTGKGNVPLPDVLTGWKPLFKHGVELFSSRAKFDREAGLSVSQPAVHSAPELGTNMFGNFSRSGGCIGYDRDTHTASAAEVWKRVQVTADAA